MRKNMPCFPKFATRSAVLAACMLAALVLLTGCGQVVSLVPTTTPFPGPTATFSPPAGPTPVPTVTPAPFTPPPTLTPTVTPTPEIYSVVPGDNLERIAAQFGVSVAALQDENNILDPRTIQPGQQLRIPSSESANGSEPLTVPTPTPASFNHQKVHFSFTPLGGLWVLGEVHNTSPYTLEKVRVGVRLLDEHEGILAEEEGSVLLNLVDPGGIAPFAILFEMAPKEFASYLIYPVSGVPAYEGGYYRDLAVEDLAFDGELYSAYQVSGSVRNIGTQETVEVQIVLTAYDPLDRVIAARTVEADHNVISAQGETTFRALLVPLGGPVERIHAAAQGRRHQPGN